MGNLIELQVGGTAYPAWTSLRVQASLEQSAGAFELEVTDAWGEGLLPGLKAGAECTLRLAGETVITGYIDALTREIDATNRTVRLSGRDKTADLVDCAATIKPYTDQDLQAIASDQAGTYGVSVATNGDLGKPFPKVAVEPGETVWELLERLARQRGLLLMADGQGGLLLGQPKKEPAGTDLVLGGNLLSLAYTLDLRDRFSEYQGLGQTAGSDERHGKDAARITATARDDTMAERRTRIKIIRGEGSETDLQARLDWERAVRFGRSLSVTAKVQGWTTSAGQLWRVGTLAQVQAQPLRLEDELLIVEAAYSLDAQGTTTTLTLTWPEAYSPEPPPPDPAGQGGKT